jgi:hypothetical protein
MNLYLDFSFLLLIAVSLVLTYLKTRQIEKTVGNFFLALLFAGSIARTSEFFFGELTIARMNTIFVLCILTLMLFVQTGKRKTKDRSYTGIYLLLISGVSVTVVIGSRVFAERQTDKVFAQLSYLLRAEDNAAWLVPASKMASGSAFSVSSVSGPLALLLSVSQSLVRLMTELFGFKATEIGTTINTVVVAYFLVLISAAFALVPILKVFSTAKPFASIAMRISIWLLFAGGLAQIASSGHLSLALVCVLFAFGIGTTFIPNVGDPQTSFIGGLVLVMASTVWLPLTYTTFISFPYLAITFWRIIKSNDGNLQKANSIIVFAVATSLMVLVNGEILRYTTRSTNQMNSLITADGGTGSADRAILLFIGFVFLGIVLSRNEREIDFSRNRAYVATMSVFLFVIGIFILNIVVGGSVNYGATKLLFGVSVVLLPVFMAIFIQHIALRVDFDSRTMLGVLVFVLMYGLSQGPIGSLVTYASPTQWKTSGTSGGWVDEVLSLESESNLKELPIGCVSVDETGDLSVNPATYECTRFMMSLTGEWDSGNYLNEYQLFFGEESIKNLELLEDEFREKKLWSLNSVNGKIIGTQSVNDIISYYSQFQETEN